VEEIVRLSDIQGFAEQAQHRFGPPPGSVDDLVAQCESLVRLCVRAERITVLSLSDCVQGSKK
jgi:hypothetical protein